MSIDELVSLDNPTLDGAVHDLTLDARSLLTNEVRQLLEGVYGLDLNGRFAPTDHLLAVQTIPEVAETRQRLERHLADEVAAGLGEKEAVEKLIKEVAFTHLNRLVALKMLEARRLTKSTIDKYQDSNAFKFYLVDHSDDMASYEAGSLPQNAAGEGPRDIAYRRFLLWQYGQLAQEIRVLFDPGNLASRLFPRPAALRQLVHMLNAQHLSDSWASGNEEAIGWVYQSFNAEDLQRAFAEARVSNAKFSAEDIPAVTQLFTPRWIVQFLVHNTLGRLWVQMHPDTQLRASLEYLVPLEADVPTEPLRPVKEITLLDPACGTMHFGLVAFDLFAQMYREEIGRAGQVGWLEEPSVAREEAIAGAIISNNIFGMEIDLRAVQLSALTLYLKAKSMSRDAEISESNLAWARVEPFDGERLTDFLESMQFTRPIYGRVIRALWTHLEESDHMGSLLRPEVEVQQLVHHERDRYRREAEGRLPLAEVTAPFELGASDEAFWEFLDLQVVQAFDEFARRRAEEGQDVTFFVGEAVKGFKLLDLAMRRYDVVVTNPPYMSARKMNAHLKSLVAAAYPAGKGDLYAAFIQRCLELACPGGRVGMLTMQSFMFITSYEQLRRLILGASVVETEAHVGPGLFAVGNPGTLQTAAYVLRRDDDEASRVSARALYFRLVKEPDAESKRRAFERRLPALRLGETTPEVFRYRQGDFDAIAGSPWVYWITPGLRRLFSELDALGDSAPPRQGLATADNLRFLRYWWEVGRGQIGRGCANAAEARASNKTWFPYMKGGGFSRWWGNQDQVINWAKDGAEIRAFPAAVVRNPTYYFRRGVTYSFLTSAQFSARMSPGGFIFDVAGSSLFSSDDFLVLALLNSSFAAYALKLINPTVNFQVGDLARLPVPAASSDSLASLVEEAVGCVQQTGTDDERNYDFVAPLYAGHEVDMARGELNRLANVEHAIDEEVYRLYGVSPDDRASIERELAALPSEDELAEAEDSGVAKAGEREASPSTGQKLARLWISFAAGIVLGRFDIGGEDGVGRGQFSEEVNESLRSLVSDDGILVLDPGRAGNLESRVEHALESMLGGERAQLVVSEATAGQSLAAYLEREFFVGSVTSHVQQYHKRPVYWLLQSSKRGYGLLLFHERVTKDTLYVIQGSQYLGSKLNQVSNRVEELRNRARSTLQGRERKAIEKDLDETVNLRTELEEFGKALRTVTAARDERGEEIGWDLEIDDGVLINLAPLWPLMPAWSAEAKKCWEALRRGDYDWSHTAMRYWPDRVLSKCRTNKSYAIAHGRLDVYQDS
jgi:N-6 DNA Methylase